MIKGVFDIILLSQSLIYIADLHRLMVELDHLLSPNGVIFIHVLNTATRPATLLLGDQVFYFTPDSLHKMAASVGLSCEQSVLDRLPTSDNMWAVLRKA